MTVEALLEAERKTYSARHARRFRLDYDGLFGPAAPDVTDGQRRRWGASVAADFACSVETAVAWAFADAGALGLAPDENLYLLHASAVRRLAKKGAGD
jgi:hypothetical protein